MKMPKNCICSIKNQGTCHKCNKHGRAHVPAELASSAAAAGNRQPVVAAAAAAEAAASRKAAVDAEVWLVAE